VAKSQVYRAFIIGDMLVFVIKKLKAVLELEIDDDED